MGHHVTAIVAPEPIVAKLQESFPRLCSVDLRDGYQLVPLDEDDLDQLANDLSQVHPGFTYLSAALVGVLESFSEASPLVYLETDYFGGVGSQAGAAFARGKMLEVPSLHGIRSINKALRAIGITSTEHGMDEFDFVGISRFRSVEDWKKAAA